MIGWRDITNTTNERSMIFSVVPFAGLSNTLPLALVSAEKPWLLPACLSTLPADYCLRQKMGGTHLTMNYLRQTAVVAPSTLGQSVAYQETGKTLDDFVLPRVLELTYTAWDLESFAQDCIAGFASREIRKKEEGLATYIAQFVPAGTAPTSLPPYSLPPFRWDEERRFLLRCELDAAFFHLYLPTEASGTWCPAEGETTADLGRLKASFSTPRDAVAYIVDTFPIVKRKDEAQFGEYRTKRVILDIYKDMQQAISTGEPYRTRLDPPPADPRVAHEAKEISTRPS
jgi:hypothetical protein